MSLLQNFYEVSCHVDELVWHYALVVARDEGLEATASTSSRGTLRSTSALALFLQNDLWAPIQSANPAGRTTLNALPTMVSAAADTLAASEVAHQVVGHLSNQLHSFPNELIDSGPLSYQNIDWLESHTGCIPRDSFV